MTVTVMLVVKPKNNIMNDNGEEYVIDSCSGDDIGSNTSSDSESDVNISVSDVDDDEPNHVKEDMFIPLILELPYLSVPGLLCNHAPKESLQSIICHYFSSFTIVTVAMPCSESSSKKCLLTT